MKAAQILINVWKLKRRNNQVNLAITSKIICKVNCHRTCKEILITEWDCNYFSTDFKVTLTDPMHLKTISKAVKRNLGHYKNVF